MTIQLTRKTYVDSELALKADLNSPILVEPNLGTPSAGNLVNCTFPTLNQDTTGNAAFATNATNADTLDGNHANYFQPASTAITTSNIGSQSVATATNATLINNVYGGRGGGNVSSNTAIGNSALQSNTTGNSNTAIGFEALLENTTGYNNTVIGFNAGRNILYGHNNVCIGYNSGNDGLITLTNAASDYIVLGNDSSQYLFCKTSTITVSDARDKSKFDIVPHGLDFVSKLNPIRYEFRKSRDEEETDGIPRYGFKAQDILELEQDDNVIINNSNPDKLSICSDYLIPVLVNAIKDLNNKVAELEQKISRSI